MNTSCKTLEQIYREMHPGVVRIYDASIDEFRDATQCDLDLALTAAGHGAKVREFAAKLHSEYLDEVKIVLGMTHDRLK